MSNFQKISTDILERQFGYTNVAKLMIERAKVWDEFFGNIVETLANQFFNIDECIPEALDYYWGRLLNITRKFEDEEGNIYTLTDSEFREVIKIKLFNWDGSLESINTFFRNVFAGRGSFFSVDTQDMTYLKFVIDFDLTENEVALFTLFDIFPRPAGIGTRTTIIPSNQKYFGFGAYDQYVESPITVGFGTYNKNPTGEGKCATYNNNI